MTFNVFNLGSKYPYFNRAYVIGGLYPFCHGCKFFIKMNVDHISFLSSVPSEPMKEDIEVR